MRRRRARSRGCRDGRRSGRDRRPRRRTPAARSRSPSSQAAWADHARAWMAGWLPVLSDCSSADRAQASSKCSCAAAGMPSVRAEPAKAKWAWPLSPPRTESPSRERDRPGGQGMGRRDVAADEPRRPQADERVHQRVPQGESLGQGAGPLERPRELGVGVAAVGVERGRHRGQRADLQQVAVEAVRQLRELPERGLVQVDRLGVREDAGGGLRGAVVVLECPGAVSGTGVLVGQLPRHLVGAAGVQELQRLRQSAVQEPARGRADLLVRRVAQQVVGEVVAAAGLVQDPQPPQLVDRADDRVGVEVRRLAEQLEVEGPADGGAQPGDVPGAVAELVEPRPEDGAQVGGRAVLRGRAGPVTGGLDDVQREPARRGHRHVGRPRPGRPDRSAAAGARRSPPRRRGSA